MDKRWKVILSFAVVFAAGAVVGGMYSPWHHANEHRKLRDGSRDGEQIRAGFAARVLHHYAARLDLTQDQVDQIQPIVVAAGEEMRKVRSDWSRDTKVVVEEMNQAVAALLTPEQRVEFEEHVLRQMKERMGRMMGGMRRRGMPGGPPRLPPPPK